MNCSQPGCTGAIEDGYCNDCGLAPSREAPSDTEVRGVSAAARASMTPTGRSRVSAGTGAVRRSRLGAGLVDIPPVPARDPESVVMSDPTVAEHRRFCGRCDEPVGRTRDGRPGRTDGFCRSCGTPFSFTAKLTRGETIGGQYEIIGCLAHGGLGWIYLARDHHVADRWVVLKGLLDSSDEHAMAAALAEKRFLAEVEHPNIVKIHNFVEHGGDGYIVMEYVNGTSLRGMLEARRADNAGPLPVEQAIAYCLEILPALGHLHELGLIFCDFKPDNVIQTSGSVKLIDLGGVYRANDDTSPVYGTTGYQAPEIATTGPTVASDLFTVARTLAVLCTDFAGYQSTFRYTLPAARDVPLYTRFDSLYTLLERATAADPDERFQSAEEMAGQLVGVLRQIISATTGSPAPGPSTRFTPAGRGSTDAPAYRTLPTPLVNPDDSQSGLILSLAAVDAADALTQLESIRGTGVETDLWLARLLIEAGRADEATAVLGDIEAVDPWEWRADWYRGVAALASAMPNHASPHLRRVYRALPGELAPQLALGVAAELAGDHAAAAGWYEIVSRTDPAFTSAAFGLARCRAALGDHAGAVAAYGRVLDTSSAHVDARLAEARLLLAIDGTAADLLPNLRRVAKTIDTVPLDREQRGELSVEALEAALHALQHGALTEDATTTVLGVPCTERALRTGLEQAYRSLARHAATNALRIALVERANRIRPRSLL